MVQPLIKKRLVFSLIIYTTMTLIAEDKVLSSEQDTVLYSSLNLHTISSEEQLRDVFRQDQVSYLLFAPPSVDLVLLQYGGSLLVTNASDFSSSFVSSLEAESNDNSVQHYPIWIYENKDGSITIENISGNVVASLKREKKYSTDWLALLYYPDLYSYANDIIDSLIELYSPQRICMQYDIIIGDENSYASLTESIKSATTSDIELASIVMRSSVIISNLCFTAVNPNTNGTVELSIAWPSSGMTTNGVDFFVSTNLLNNTWNIGLTTNLNLSSGVFSWIDTPATNTAGRFYDLWTLYDYDGDGLSDGREFRIYGTDAGLFDTSGDGLGDGISVFYGLNPAGNNALSDPDDDGFSTLEETIVGTDPTQANQNNLTGETGTIRFYYDKDDRLTSSFSDTRAAISTTLDNTHNITKSITAGGEE
ncbi:MAG: hypothetical protein PF692_01125 [Kiritimatiellae bacterium]|jgi:hypothetical protein|nr:hypothetical protein [Kiritimatiellia bacterium]